MIHQSPLTSPERITVEYGGYFIGGHPHAGIDLIEASGTVTENGIRPVSPGIVKRAEFSSSLGNYVVIQHYSEAGAPIEEYSLYAHLRDSSPLQVDEIVSLGSVIGTMGNTGRSDGIHLHFSLHTSEPLVAGSEGATDAPIGSFFDDEIHIIESWSQQNIIGDGRTFLSNSSGQDWIFALTGNDVLYGSAISDKIDAGKGNDFVFGDGGDDQILGGPGDDAIDGGDDTDTIIYSFSRPNYGIRVVGNTILVEGPEGTDHLRNVEWITFRDAGGPPFQSIDVMTLDGYGDLLVTDPSAFGFTYDATMGNTWFTTANSTAPIRTDAADWGVREDGTGSLLDQLISGWSWSLEDGPDGAQAFTARRGGELRAFSETLPSLDFGPLGSVAFSTLLQPKLADDHTDTSSGAVTIGSGAITSFTSSQGSIESRSDVDVFEAQLQGGQEYSFLLWANTTQNSRLDPELTIRSPSGTVWRNDNLTNNTTMSFLSFVAPQSGTYVFEARGVGDSTGSYWLNITPINIDPTADNLTPTTGETDPGNSSWDWQGTEDRDDFPTPGWDPHKGNLDAANRLRGHDGDDRIEAGGGNDVIWGDRGEDRLYGEDGDDTIRGGRHDDLIDGGNGDDLIYGEDGDDNIDGDISSSNGFGHDTIYGGDGEDNIDGGRGNDYIKGEDDNDTLDGNDGDDEIYGDRGDDDIDGDDGDDLLFGGPGNDTLDGGEGRDRLAGEDGDDFLEGDDGDDALYGGDDDDILRGGPGDDLLHGERGTDTADFSDGRSGVIVNLFDEIAVSSDLGTDLLYDIDNVIGSRGDDVIDGDHSRNELRGDRGDDIIRGHNGNDTIYGDDDDDVVWGDGGDDHVYGGDDDDEVRGGLGNDHLFGDSGDDHLRGEQGDDVIDGGTGTDTVFFWGEHDDFSINVGGGGEVIVTDLRTDGLEGRDVLTNVEYIEFFDGKALVSDLLAVAPSALNDTVEVDGNRPASLALLDNDTTNASSAHYTGARVSSGLGSASIIGGQLVYDPEDSYIGLPVGETASVTIEYSFTTSGFQTASGRADLTVNGTAVAAPVYPNLRDSYVGWNDSELTAGQVPDVEFQILNDGEADAGAFLARLYLSQDGVIDGGEALVGEYSFAALPAGAETDVSQGLLPVPEDLALGGYYYLLSIDPNNEVAERDEADNEFFSGTGFWAAIEVRDAPSTWYIDGDADGFGVDDPTTNQTAYEAPAGTSDLAGDADDGDATVFPGAPEINDGKDNDQDGDVDEDNTAPVADVESFEVAEDGTLTVAAATLLEGDTDADGDALAVAGVSNEQNGTVSLDDKGDGDASNDEVIFTPTLGYSGPASFDYTVADGFGGEDTASVGVAVNADATHHEVAGVIQARDGGGLADTTAIFRANGVSSPAVETKSIADGSFTLMLDDETGGHLDATRNYESATDSSITASDALEVLRLAVGLDASWGQADAFDFIAADINRSGEVTASDALEVLRHAVGLETENPPEWVFINDDADFSHIDGGNVAYDTGIDLTAIDSDVQLSMSGVLLGNMEDYV